MLDITELATRTTDIDGLHVITMKQVHEDRGVVREFYRESAFAAAGLPSLGPFLQVNATETKKGGLRGLHAEDMSKLVAVVAGEAFGAYVDLRAEAPSFGAVVTVPLRPGTQVLVPKGVANGFQSVEDGTQYVYCFTAEWVPGMAGQACNPLDPALGIDWPVPVDPDDRTQISEKDLTAPRFAELRGSGR
jgi:dTDP-4-dehydrorhamnose 3,5-epimerase